MALLLTSLGPVQDFIASARRCQDLWFGSFLLSELSRATALALEHAAGPNALIFPQAINDDAHDRPGVANKILARIPSVEMAGDIAEKGRAAMAVRLRALRDQAFTGLDDRCFDRQRAITQIDELIEYDWVAVASQGADGYDHARKSAERLLAARKNTRVWSKVTSGARVPKCSIDGIRESVIDEAIYDDLRKNRRRAAEVRDVFHVKKIERLCGVCLLKRMGADGVSAQSQPAFHSTSHVASAPTRTRLARRANAADRLLGGYVATLMRHQLNLDRFALRADAPEANLAWSWRIGEPVTTRLGRTLVAGERHFDGELLYEHHLRDIFEHHAASRDLSAAVRDATTALRTALEGQSVPTYYAFLQADGDGMGEAIEKIGTVEGHRALGEALDHFSKECRTIVERHAGSLVYAGGDDVLALLPLHTALECANALRSGFVACLSTLHLPHTPTLSVGLGITHHMAPMAEARALAKTAEGLAKAYDGAEGKKNALGIVFGKRSGADLHVVGSWAEKAPIHCRIEHLIQLFHAGELSSKAAYDLEDAIAPMLIRGAGAVMEQQHAVVASLARCVLGRKRTQTGEGKPDAIGQWLDTRLGEHDLAASVQALASELQIALAFLPAYATAYGDLDQEPAR